MTPERRETGARDAAATRVCPFCKETVNAEAVVCKHCRSAIPAEAPPHGGICPFCKEEVHKEAIKCKHCGSAIGPRRCGCSSPASPQIAGTLPAASTTDTAQMPGASPIAMAAGKSCGPCQYQSVLTHVGALSFGTRTCSIQVPILRPDGKVEMVTVYTWTESCGGTVFTPMPW